VLNFLQLHKLKFNFAFKLKLWFVLTFTFSLTLKVVLTCSGIIRVLTTVVKSKTESLCLSVSGAIQSSAVSHLAILLLRNFELATDMDVFAMMEIKLRCGYKTPGL